jgi:predicted metal-dependent peptidase
MTEPDLVQRVLARLLLRHPFLATLALRLRRVADPTTPSAWTNGVHLAVNPGWFAQLGDEQRLSLIAHECYHVALGHHLRRGGRDMRRWNRACDYAVNALLVDDGFTLFPDALYDPAFGDASAEAIYNQLAPPPDPATSATPSAPAASGAAAAGTSADPSPPSAAAPAAAQDPAANDPGTTPPGAAGSGNPSTPTDPGAPSAQPSLSPGTADASAPSPPGSAAPPGDSAADSPAATSPGAGAPDAAPPGSSAPGNATAAPPGGVSTPGAAPPTSPHTRGGPPPEPSPSTAAPAALPPSPETLGEIRDQPLPAPPTPAEREARLAEHAILITALAQQARAAGHDSAGARRATTAAKQPATIDWRTLLVEFLTCRHTQDYSWLRPNPRYAHLGLFLPRLEPAAPGSVAFVLDTSGSVPSAALDAVTAELEAYLRGYPSTNLQVLYADAEVTGVATYTAADLPLRLEPNGGGGTHFGPALATLTEADEPPACIVYLTDLQGSFPDDPPPMPIIWLVFGQPLTPPTAPFGKVIPLPY